MAIDAEVYINECHKLLVVTGEQAVPLLSVLDVIKLIRNDGFEQLQPIIIAQASARCLMWIDSDSIDAVICFRGSYGFPNHLLLGAITRVLKPGGTILVYLCSLDSVSYIKKMIQAHKFLDIQSSDSQPFWVSGKKPPKEDGASSSIKDTPQIKPEVQIDDGVKQMDEDDILTNEDAKKTTKAI